MERLQQESKYILYNCKSQTKAQADKIVRCMVGKALILDNIVITHIEEETFIL